MDKNVWTVFSAEGDEVRATRWTDEGPQPVASVVEICTTHEAAEKSAAQMQASYDRLRGAMAE